MLKDRVRANKKSQPILLAHVYLPRKWQREREKNQFGRHTRMFPYRDSCRKTKYYTQENLRGCKIECGVWNSGMDLIIWAVCMDTDAHRWLSWLSIGLSYGRSWIRLRPAHHSGSWNNSGESATFAITFAYDYDYEQRPCLIIPSMFKNVLCGTFLKNPNTIQKE